MTPRPNIWRTPTIRAHDARKARGRAMADLKRLAAEQAKAKEAKTDA